ncbi:hypothetical protein CRG98_006519 [Punica granatum]|uniref:Uncharacterized protein n=1 Tax=Punica granatum TaxID=22663 RepID=A0A2I0KXB0_PUNGR|nr:hypothetical protein CRG98_006519 [Punica granatum]
MCKHTLPPKALVEPFRLLGANVAGPPPRVGVARRSLQHYNIRVVPMDRAQEPGDMTIGGNKKKKGRAFGWEKKKKRKRGFLYLKVKGGIERGDVKGLNMEGRILRQD